MFEDLRRLSTRGLASRGTVVDADGAVLGPDCVLVDRVAQRWRCIGRGEAAALQSFVLGNDPEPGWLFHQCRLIANALADSDIARVQILGLRIPVGVPDDRQLKQLALAAPFIKAGFDPDEPRVPAGNPDGGQWTTEGDESAIVPAAARRPAGRTPNGDPDKFFDTIYERVHALAQRLGIGEDWLLGLAAHESGYLNADNRAINNLFGTTRGGGPNVHHSSIDAAIAYWEGRFGPVVRGATRAEDFVQRLFADRYNTNPAWPGRVLSVISSIPRRLSSWKTKREI
jgi:hypothetical protein